MLQTFAVLCLFFPLYLSLSFDSVYYEFGENLGQRVPSRIVSLLKSTGVSVSEYSSEAEGRLTASSLVLSFGNASFSRTVTIDDLSPEGFKVESQVYTASSTLVVSNGKPMDFGDREFALDADKVHYGAAVGSYAVLEMLGFSFSHPLQPYVPSSIQMFSEAVSVTESPYWEKRTWHIHTQHPLEFAEVLNGFDIPMFVESDEGDSVKCPPRTYCESWESMFSTLDGLFEWLLANRQNRVEVLLLGNFKWDKWGDLNSGPTRQERLKKISALSHEFGILIGADIPLANLQQHGWAMISLRDDFEQQSKDIEDRVDWAFAADYDFISTESGLSEFTKPTCDLMLQLFETYTARVHTHWKREAVTKVHCSTDQVCNDLTDSGELKYPDPRTGEPINFNFLPTYASAGLGVMPHTVQVYNFDDPTAGAYGNENFSYMFDYINYEASRGKRDVLFYGETAYWVNVDVDVPLFLPLYGQRRLSDLRKIAREESSSGHRMNGQMNFESGWEFGYHLWNSVTARAVWNPLISEEEDDWLAFERALLPLLSPFGSLAAEVSQAIISLSKDQAAVLIDGKVNGRSPSDLSKLSGHAYMSGSDTWVDIPRILNISFTQPDKVHLNEPEDPQWEDALGMLEELQRVFGKHNDVFSSLVAQAGGELDQNAVNLLTEFADSVRILSLRARHNYALYQSQDLSASPVKKDKLLLDGRGILSEATDLMQTRRDAFRVPYQRIAEWRQGPTVYPYGYVWAATSLYYWWRDQGIAESRSLMSSSPCYLNRMEPLELGIGWGKAIEQALRIVLKKKGHSSNETTAGALLADCLAPPIRPIEFPRDL